MQAQPIENVRNNVFQLEIVKKSKQNSKMKTDGAEEQTPNNNSVDRWVHTIREKSDVKKCIDYLYEKALSATNLDTQLSVSSLVYICCGNQRRTSRV